jgi:hypothetical protein
MSQDRPRGGCCVRGTIVLLVLLVLAAGLCLFDQPGGGLDLCTAPAAVFGAVVLLRWVSASHPFLGERYLAVLVSPADLPDPPPKLASSI